MHGSNSPPPTTPITPHGDPYHRTTTIQPEFPSKTSPVPLKLWKTALFEPVIHSPNPPTGATTTPIPGPIHQRPPRHLPLPYPTLPLPIPLQLPPDPAQHHHPNPDPLLPPRRPQPNLNHDPLPKPTFPLLRLLQRRHKNLLPTKIHIYPNPPMPP